MDLNNLERLKKLLSLLKPSGLTTEVNSKRLSLEPAEIEDWILANKSYSTLPDVNETLILYKT